MAKPLSLFVAVVFLSIASLARAQGKSESTVDYTTNASQKYSPFVMSFYEALKSGKVFDRLFDVSFKPEEVGPEMYRNIRLFMMLLGVKNPSVLPTKVAEAAKKAFQKDITPFKYYKAYADSKEESLKSMGVLQKHNQDQVIQLFVSTLKKAVRFVGGSGPKAGLRALSLGSADFFRVLGAATPSQAKSHIERFLAQLLKA